MPILSQDTVRQAGRPSVLDAPLDADVGPLRSRPGAPQPIGRSASTGSLQVDFSRSGFERRPELPCRRARQLGTCPLPRRAARFHAALERGADAPGANGQRVHRDAEPLRQVAATIDLLCLNAPRWCSTTSSRCSGWSFWRQQSRQSRRWSRSARPASLSGRPLRHSDGRSRRWGSSTRTCMRSRRTSLQQDEPAQPRNSSARRM